MRRRPAWKLSAMVLKQCRAGSPRVRRPLWAQATWAAPRFQNVPRSRPPARPSVGAMVAGRRVRCEAGRAGRLLGRLARMLACSVMPWFDRVPLRVSIATVWRCPAIPGPRQAWGERRVPARLAWQCCALARLFSCPVLVFGSPLPCRWHSSFCATLRAVRSAPRRPRGSVRAAGGGSPSHAPCNGQIGRAHV